MKKINLAKKFLNVGLILNIVILGIWTTVVFAGIITTLVGGILLLNDSEFGGDTLGIGVYLIVYAISYGLV